MKYKDYLKTEHWKQLARMAKENADNKCQLCNSGGELHAHHRTYERVGCEKDGDVICLCADCHGKFHDKNEPDVDFSDDLTNVEIFVNEVNATLRDFNFESMEYFAYWASYVCQHESIYEQSNDDRFQKAAKEACVTNTANAIRETVWYSDGDVDIKNKLRDLSFLPHRIKEIEF